MNKLIPTSILLLLLQSCSNASFESIDKNSKAKANSGNGDASGAVGGGGGNTGAGDSDPDGTGSGVDTGNGGGNSADPNAGGTNGNPPNNGNPGGGGTDNEGAPRLELEVSTSVNTVEAGKKPVEATAKLKNGTETKDVEWEVKGPEGVDAGSIDANGVYTSPLSAPRDLKVVITATLKSDSSVKASKEITVTPELFVPCRAGNIFADVYEIPRNSQALPNFATLTPKFFVCLQNYAVANRPFLQGFPDKPELIEYFALKTRTKIVIPTQGFYEFRLNSDDGARMAINGNEVINNDGLHAERAITIRIELAAGEHNLDLNYFQGPREFIALQLFWKKPGTASFEIVPPEAFRPR